jgi:hypothetical protein
MPRDEDLRGAVYISRDGRGTLNYGEQRALEQQAANQRSAAGLSPAETERRQSAPAVDRAMKAPSHFVDSIGSSWRSPTR